MTLANKITILRIVLIPLFIIGLTQNWSWTVFIYLPIMISDCADGLIARIRKEQTQLGAFLDPMADRLLLIFTFLTMSYRGLAPRWFLVLVVSRDFLVVLGWFLFFLITDKKDVSPRASGKIAVILQMFLVLFILSYPSAITSGRPPFVGYFLYLAAAATAWSMLDYAFCGIKKFSKYA